MKIGAKIARQKLGLDLSREQAFVLAFWNLHQQQTDRHPYPPCMLLPAQTGADGRPWTSCDIQRLAQVWGVA